MSPAIQSIVVLSICSLVLLYWFVLIFLYPLYLNYLTYRSMKEALESGETVSGKVIESNYLGEKNGAGLRPIEMTLEFLNFSGTPVTEKMRFMDSKPDLRRYDVGQLVPLRIVRKSSGARKVTVASAKVGASLRFWIIWLIGASLYCGGIYYFFYRISEHFKGDLSLALSALHSEDAMGVLVMFAIGGGITWLLSRVFGGAFRRDQSEKLKFFGIRTMATIEKKSRTGVSVNDQPQVAFHYSFRASDGQTYKGSDKEIVDLLDIGKLDSITEREIIYLPDSPQTSLFVEHIEGSSGMGILIKVIIQFVLLILSIVLVSTVIGGLLSAPVP
ncbi:MAG: hypothetical protein KDK37_03600 [Leptospiraceae bacterium]|nr:hypothetical protein [Leptospiraceae bacterium]